MKHMLSLLTVLGTLGATAVSQAATINLDDPTVGSKAAGKTTYTYEDAADTGVDMTVTASEGGTITFQTGDGLGVRSQADGYNPPSFIADDWERTADEINQNEQLTVSFSEDVKIQSIGLTDLYASPDTGFYTWIPDEAGTWVLKDADGTEVAHGSFVGEEQRNPDGSSSYTKKGTNGELVVDIGVIARAVTLESSIKGIEGRFKGFSLASVTFETVSVPELSASGASSAAFLLAGVGLVFAAGRRRRQLGEPS